MSSIKEKSLKNASEALGKKLGFLITALFGSQKERQFMSALLAKMTPEQLVNFSEVLENKYLQTATKPIDEEYKQALETIQTDTQNKRIKLKQETLSKLQDLASGLKSKVKK